MKAPDLPADEAARIATLHSLSLLDTPPEERFDRITRLAKRIFGVKSSLVSLVDEERQWFKSKSGLDASETPRDVSFCGHAILGDSALMVPNALLDQRFFDNPLVTGTPNIRFYVGYPLKVGAMKVGTLCLLDDKPRSFSNDELALLKDLAEMVQQELTTLHLATTDELTTLSNRRGFEALGRQALSVCRRLRKPATLLFFDLDHFKSINDRHGHAEGDRALQGFARVLLQVFRDSDVVGRLGGDEFVVLLTDTLPAATGAILSRLHEALDHYNKKANRGYAIRFSVGQIEFDPVRHLDMRSLLADSDAAMYAQKQKRRREADTAAG